VHTAFNSWSNCALGWLAGVVGREALVPVTVR
jgi:hypothetical protein